MNIQTDNPSNIFHLLARSVPSAVAFVSGSRDYPDIEGQVYFYQMPEGVYVITQLYGLPSSELPCSDSIFAMHIHEGNSCTGNSTDPFADAGTHYNPKNCPHPYHAGDLPPVFSNNGYAWSGVLTDRFSVQEILWKTVIIHSGVDDFKTQPSGDSGSKIACGVIQPTRRMTYSDSGIDFNDSKA